MKNSASEERNLVQILDCRNHKPFGGWLVDVWPSQLNLLLVFLLSALVCIRKSTRHLLVFIDGLSSAGKRGLLVFCLSGMLEQSHCAYSLARP